MTTPQVLRGYSGRMLLATTAGYTFLQAGRLVIPPMIPVIIQDYSLTEAGVGTALTAMWGVYAVCQYLSGRLSDELSRKTLLVAGMGLLGVGLLAMGGAPNFAVFLAGLLTIGVGAGLFPTAAYALLSELFVDDRGNALGVFTSGADVGGIVAAALAALALAVGLWQMAFVPIAVAAVVTATAIHMLSDEPYELRAVSLDLRGSFNSLTSDARIGTVLVAWSFYVFTWQGFTSFLPAYLQAEKGFSPTVASASFAVLFVVGAATKPTAGWLSDHTRRLNVSLAATALGVATLAALVVADRPAVVLLAVVAFALGLMAYPPVMQSYLFDILPTDDRGRDFGSIRTVYLVVGSAGPGATGVLVTRYGYAVAFSSLIGALALAGGAVLWLWVRSR